ncbi:unnamed protein product [Cochlearia groenlandica]
MESERSSSLSTSSETITIQHHRHAQSSPVSTVTRRMYECTFCKRGFTNAQALGGHMNIHRRDRVNKTKIPKKADVAISDGYKRFHVAASDFGGYEKVDSVMLRTTSNLALRLGSMATKRDQNVVVAREGDGIDLELRLGL